MLLVVVVLLEVSLNTFSGSGQLSYYRNEEGLSCIQEGCAQVGMFPDFGLCIKDAKAIGDDLLLKTDLRHTGLRSAVVMVDT